MSNSLFIQIGMIAVAGVIFYMYVLPTFEQIGINQDAVVQYQGELEKVQGVNTKLSMHLASVQAVPLQDRKALERYLTTSVDDVEVMKEITTILSINKITATALSFDGAGQEVSIPELSSQFVLVPYEFSVSLETTYDQLKSLLQTIESSDYLLEVNSMTVAPGEGDDVAVELSLIRYAIATAALAEGASAEGAAAAAQ
jgi:hypothetical protein